MREEEPSPTHHRHQRSSRIAIAEEGKWSCILSYLSLLCFLVADEGDARTIAVIYEEGVLEGAIMVAAVTAVE
ncbi:hypothetical protein AHAS_Ahas09G0135600 [Arachis hypogaea]